MGESKPFTAFNQATLVLTNRASNLGGKKSSRLSNLSKNLIHFYNLEICFSLA